MAGSLSLFWFTAQCLARRWKLRCVYCRSWNHEMSNFTELTDINDKSVSFFCEREANLSRRWQKKIITCWAMQAKMFTRPMWRGCDCKKLTKNLSSEMWKHHYNDAIECDTRGVGNGMSSCWWSFLTDFECHAQKKKGRFGSNQKCNSELKILLKIFTVVKCLTCNLLLWSSNTII